MGGVLCWGGGCGVEAPSSSFCCCCARCARQVRLRAGCTALPGRSEEGSRWGFRVFGAIVGTNGLAGCYHPAGCTWPPPGGLGGGSAHIAPMFWASAGQRRSAPVSAGQRRSAPVSAGQRGAGSDPQRPEGAWGGRGGCLGVPWGGGVGVQAFAGGCHLTELTGFIGHNFTEPEQVVTTRIVGFPLLPNDSANAEQPFDQGHSCSRRTQNPVKASVKAPTTAFAASLVRGATSRGGGAVMCKGVGKQRFYRGLEADVIFRPKNKTESPT